MTDLVTRLREAIDETERIAQSALNHPTKYDPATQEELPNGTDDGAWKTSGCDVESANVPWGGGIRIYDEGGHNEEQAEHIARHDPASVLRRCAADRKILDRAEMVLSAGPNDLDANGRCYSDPIARIHMRATVADLAEAYGVEA